MAVDQIKIRQCENELHNIEREIAQFESERMSPDCNLEGIKEREAQLIDRQAKLQEELTPGQVCVWAVNRG